MHSIAAQGIDSEAVGAEFAEHAKEEQEHMLAVAERIDQLGGKPNFSPDGLLSRSASEYGDADKLIEMIKENLNRRTYRRRALSGAHSFLRR